MKRGLKYLSVIFAAVLVLISAVPSAFSETAFAKSKSKTANDSAAGESTKDTDSKENAKNTDNTESEKNTESTKDTDNTKNSETGKNTETGKSTETDNGDIKEKKEKPYTREELRYLSAIIYCEAKDQTLTSMIAVGNVVINRKNDTKESRWGHVATIKDVIYDRRWGVQFTPAYSSINSMKDALRIYDNLASYEGKWQYTAMKEAKKAAKAALTGTKMVPDSYFYFNGKIEKTKTKCFENGTEYMVISRHIYY